MAAGGGVEEAGCCAACARAGGGCGPAAAWRSAGAVRCCCFAGSAAGGEDDGGADCGDEAACCPGAVKSSFGICSCGVSFSDGVSSEGFGTSSGFTRSTVMGWAVTVPNGCTSLNSTTSPSRRPCASTEAVMPGCISCRSCMVSDRIDHCDENATKSVAMIQATAAASIPFGRKSKVGQTSFRIMQREDLGHFLVGQLEIENVDVLREPLELGGARDGRDVLLDEPAETDLCRRLAVVAPDPYQRLVGLDLAFCDRAIGDHREASVGACCPDLALVQIRMVLDLVADQPLRAGLHRLPDQRHREIGNADVACQPHLLGVGERAERLGQRHLRIGPVQQQQIDMGLAQPHQALLGRALQVMRSEMIGPDLGGEEDVVALHAGCTHPVPDLALVLIDLRGVEMAIAEFQRLLHKARTGASAQLPGAKSDCGDFGAIGLDDMHGKRARQRCRKQSQNSVTGGIMACVNSAANCIAGRSDHAFDNAANTVSGACAITASSARAGPRGMRLPCSQFRMVSTGTPTFAANSCWVSRARRRRSRTCGVSPGVSSSAAPAASASIAGASGHSRPSRNSTIRPSAFSRKRCMT